MGGFEPPPLLLLATNPRCGDEWNEGHGIISYFSEYSYLFFYLRIWLYVWIWMCVYVFILWTSVRGKLCNCIISSFSHTPVAACYTYLIKPFHSVIGLPRTPCFLVRTNQQTNNNLFFFNSPPLGLTRVIPLATVHLSTYRILFTPQHTPPPVFYKTATDLEGL